MIPENVHIFYLEDDPESLGDYYEILAEKYTVVMGALRKLIEKPREKPFDLLSK